MTIPVSRTIPAQFADLPFGEQLILWAVRLWVRTLKDGANAHEVLETGFKLAGAAGAHLALDDLMTIIANTAEGNIDIRCPKCHEISFDEHRLMGAIAAWQCDAGSAVADTFFEAWMPPAGRRLARTPSARLADALEGAGLMIRPRQWVHHAPVEDRPAESFAAVSTALH